MAVQCCCMAVQCCYMAVQCCCMAVQCCYMAVQCCCMAVQCCYMAIQCCCMAVQCCYMAVQCCCMAVLLKITPGSDWTGIVWVSAKISLGSFMSLAMISYFLCKTDSNWFLKRVWPFFYLYNTGRRVLAVIEVNCRRGMSCP